MSNIIINETPIEVELSNTIIQSIVDETKIEIGLNETVFAPIINEDKIEMELGQVIDIGGSFMLDDLTKVTIIDSGETLPEITQEKELLIIKNS